MGAYENPKIIPPPDYGQIFRTNFVAGQQLVQSAIDKRNAKIEKEKAKQQALADKQLAFDLKAGEIKAGDLTGALQKLAYNQASIFGKNEAQWANGDISFEDYTSTRNQSFRMLQELKQTGAILDAQSKAFDKFERSSFQNNPELLALAEAWENKAIIPEYIDGELFLNYKVGEENHTISVENFKEGSFFDMVEKYDISNETMTALNLDADIKKKINKRTVYDANNNIIASSSESYVENKETYIDRIKEGPRMKDLLSNVDDAGSIWADNISKTTNEEKLNQVLESIAISKNITGKEKEAFINAAKDGIYTNGTITDKEGKKLNYRELINEASAQILAERSFDNYLPNALKLSGGAQGFQETKDSGEDTTPAKIKPFQDYVKQTYGGTQTGTEGKRIMDFLTDYNSLGLNNVTTADGLIEELKKKSSNQLGVQVGGNPYQNYTTVSKLRGELMTNPQIFANKDGKSYRGHKPSITRTLDYLKGRNDNDIIILPAREDSNGTYFYIGDNSRKIGKDESFQFISDSNNLNLMVEILKGVEKFKNVDPDVLYKELELYQKDPNRFN